VSPWVKVKGEGDGERRGHAAGASAQVKAPARTQPGVETSPKAPPGLGPAVETSPAPRTVTPTPRRVPVNGGDVGGRGGSGSG